MPTLTLIPCILSPRIEHLADWVAGLLSVQRRGIPQTLYIHPADIALITPMLAH
jgi:hypothetical protein